MLMSFKDPKYNEKKNFSIIHEHTKHIKKSYFEINKDFKKKCNANVCPLVCCVICIDKNPYE